MRTKFIFVTGLVCLLVINSCKKTETDTGPVYSKVGITKFTILNYPATPLAGGTWDDAFSGTYPDVYFSIRKFNTNDYLYVLNKDSRIVNLQTSGLPVSWSATNGSAFFTVTNLYETFSLDLWDYDNLSSDEYIGSSSVNFSNYNSGASKYPSNVTITNGFVTIKLDLNWQL